MIVLFSAELSMFFFQRISKRASLLHVKIPVVSTRDGL